MFINVGIIRAFFFWFCLIFLSICSEFSTQQAQKRKIKIEREKGTENCCRLVVIASTRQQTLTEASVLLHLPPSRLNYHYLRAAKGPLDAGFFLYLSFARQRSIANETITIRRNFPGTGLFSCDRGKICSFVRSFIIVKSLAGSPRWKRAGFAVYDPAG